VSHNTSSEFYLYFPPVCRREAAYECKDGCTGMTVKTPRPAPQNFNVSYTMSVGEASDHWLAVIVLIDVDTRLKPLPLQLNS
jgi:hypothetical protein